MSIYDVEPEELIKLASGELKKYKEMTPPSWTAFAKTGAGKERAPEQKDWYYIRAASVLRKLYTGSPVGISRLRGMYSSKKNRGVKPPRVYKTSGALIRKILKSFETLGFVSKTKRGRVLTPKGTSFLDKVALQTAKKHGGD